ncbi:hypothetical protein VMCG_04489 [Cytospora schulzeri]|uniref:Fe2OG dioxygenase domain-containing protein n=1 Tax=Cytospora schulzeri TaxID=448051 RepID=A0A423WRW3_9PEZI|nr:hypothetical protein VMCG_04489 [Valsa malicola]
MATQTSSASASASTSGGEVDTFQLQLSSGNGPVYRTVLRTPLRDATPDEIPIIDISGIFSSSFEGRLAVARKIHDAATNNGFFYIKGHGIPSTVTDSAHQACLDFFRQDIDTKQKANAEKSTYFNGYKPPKTQRINPTEGIDNRETFSWTYDPRCDPAVGDLSSIPEQIREFMRVEPDGPEGSEDDRFPWSETKTVPHFKPAVVDYWRSCLALARRLVQSFALSLDLPETFFDAKFSHPDAALALNYYPPITPRPAGPGRSPGGGEDEEEVSIGSHTDFQLFTMLWQDANGGLQVLNRQGQWINAKPVEGTFVVNIADYLQRITNDKYISTVHRAVNNSGKERISMPFFFGFNCNESCGVLDSCVGADGVRKYEEVGCLEWVKRRVKAMHDTETGKAVGSR